MERSSQIAGGTQNKCSGGRSNVDSARCNIDCDFSCLSLLSRGFLVLAGGAGEQAGCENSDQILSHSIHKELCRSIYTVLERNLQRKLNLTRIARCRQKSKLRRAEGSGVDRILRSGLRELQVRMVEHVEKLRAEFELDLFSDVKILEQAEIPNLIAGPTQRIAPKVAEGSECGITKRAGVEKCSR